MGRAVSGSGSETAVRRRTDAFARAELSGARSVIVSDLHVETWTDEPFGEGPRRKSKLAHWCDFLDWCDEVGIDELIVNGDLMDAPPYRGSICFTSATVRQAVEKLLWYAARRTVTYIYGNHDIGISGVRCASTTSLMALRNVNLYYPGYVLHTDTSTVLVQHGHLFDPALLLYLKDLNVRTYLMSDFQAFQWVQQRRDRHTGEHVVEAGVASPAAIGMSPETTENVYYAIKLADTTAPPSPEETSAARRFLQGLRRGIVKNVGGLVKHHLWWEAAKDVFRDYLSQDTVDRPTIYCVMGHTHVPDTGETEMQGKRCLYFNSGTWTSAGEGVEDRQHATYLDVREDGKMWVQDWIRNPYSADA
jgi:UDP-2,3-diacylglucosamine pyrophosphatase LpxH